MSVCPWADIPYNTDAWHIFGIGIGQPEIVAFGLVAGTVGTIGYRTFTRGKKY
jgi:hypothetical protein